MREPRGLVAVRMMKLAPRKGWRGLPMRVTNALTELEGRMTGASKTTRKRWMAKDRRFFGGENWLRAWTGGQLPAIGSKR